MINGKATIVLLTVSKSESWIRLICNKNRFEICNRCWYIKTCKKIDLANLESNVDKLDIDKLKIVLTNSNNLKIKVDKLGVDQLVSVPVDLSKLSDVVKNGVVKKDAYNAKTKKLKIKCLTLLT